MNPKFSKYDPTGQHAGVNYIVKHSGWCWVYYLLIDTSRLPGGVGHDWLDNDYEAIDVIRWGFRGVTWHEVINGRDGWVMIGTDYDNAAMYGETNSAEAAERGAIETINEFVAMFPDYVQKGDQS